MNAPVTYTDERVNMEEYARTVPLWKRVWQHSLTQMALLSVQAFCGPAMADAIAGNSDFTTLITSLILTCSRPWWWRSRHSPDIEHCDCHQLHYARLLLSYRWTHRKQTRNQMGACHRCMFLSDTRIVILLQFSLRKPVVSHHGRSDYRNRNGYLVCRREWNDHVSRASKLSWQVPGTVDRCSKPRPASRRCYQVSLSKLVHWLSSTDRAQPV